MAVITSDIHGNINKLKMFLEYKPEEEHIIAGDILDSFTASDDQIRECFTLATKSNATILWGNHTIHYLLARPFVCSGYRDNQGYTLAVEGYKYAFKAAVYRDGYLITHAGVHPALNKKIKDPEEMADWINDEFEKYLHENEGKETSPYTRGVNKNSKIFDIGSIRGGWAEFGGPFWLDWSYEKLDPEFNQVVGHTHDKHCQIQLNPKQGTRWIKVDADEFCCYNTCTHLVEDFMTEEMKPLRDSLEVRF